MMIKRLVIQSVTDGLTAHQYGLQVGDILDTYNGFAVDSSAALSDAISRAGSGVAALTYYSTQGRKEIPQPTGRLGIDVVEHHFDPDTYLQERELSELEGRIIVTSTPAIEGYRIARTIELISAECVFGLNIFKDFLAGLTDVFGGRSKTTQRALRDARRTCIMELKREAALVGANAVVGVDLDYSEFSGQGKSMLFLVATGTAVVVEKA